MPTPELSNIVDLADNDDDDDYGLQEDEVSPVPSLSVEPLAGGVLTCNTNIITPILYSV